MHCQSRDSIPKIAKFKDFLNCLFRMETVLIFYLLLFILSAVILDLKFKVFIYRILKTYFQN